MGQAEYVQLIIFSFQICKTVKPTAKLLRGTFIFKNNNGEIVGADLKEKITYKHFKDLTAGTSKQLALSQGREIPKANMVKNATGLLSFKQLSN